MSGAIDLVFGASAVRRRILAAFYAAPGLVTHPRELARRLGHPSQVVGRELRRLEDAGILASETVGRVRRYRVDVDSPIAADVRGLVLRTIGAEALIGASLGDVAGIEEAWIFGSHARGTERPSSDIDLLVIGLVDRAALSERLVEVEQELGRDVNVVAYTRGELADLVSAGDPFISDVLAGPRTRVTVAADR
jgi:predicted nucleotidyltransferase